MNSPLHCGNRILYPSPSNDDALPLSRGLARRRRCPVEGGERCAATTQDGVRETLSVLSRGRSSASDRQSQTRHDTAIGSRFLLRTKVNRALKAKSPASGCANGFHRSRRARSGAEGKWRRATEKKRRRNGEETEQIRSRYGEDRHEDGKEDTDISRDTVFGFILNSHSSQNDIQRRDKYQVQSWVNGGPGQVRVLSIRRCS